MSVRVKTTFCLIASLLLLNGCLEESASTSDTSNTSTVDLGISTVPYSVSFTGTTTVDLSKGIYVVPALATSTVFVALSRFVDGLKTLQISSSDPEGIPLKVNVTNKELKSLNLDTDESYSLNITSTSIDIACSNHVGLTHALNTLSQLLFLHKGDASLPIANIKDEPRFQYRGLMIDVSRHWIPKEVLLENIRYMSAAKLNVLHLHLSDDQSFRVESKKFPDLTSKGSDGNYYSQEDMKEIVTLAQSLGIRVIPEFDMPGHVSSILAAYPDLGANTSARALEKSYGIHKAVLDPTSEKTYAFIKTLFIEMATLFPDDYMHIGGGEVRYDDWASNKKISGFMKKNDLASPIQLQAYFTLRVQRILTGLGKKMMAWDEALRPELPKGEGVIFQSRLGRSSLNQAVQLGYKSIASSGWILDQNLSSSEMYEIDPVYTNSELIVTPDTSAYHIFSIESTISDRDISGFLYVFGENQNNLSGLFQFPGQVIPFEKALMTGGSFKFQNTKGSSNISALITYSSDFSINGNLSIDGLPLGVSGSKVGGHDVPDGMKLPPLASTKALTRDQEELIIGGEACMWTEWVDQHNITSRIWPRASVVADKLWSPYQEMSSATKAFQRQVQFQKYLEALGINSNQSRQSYIESIADYPKALQVETFISALEQVKGNKRFINNVDHNIDAPLDQLADVVTSESIVSHNIGVQIDKIINQGSNDETGMLIEAQLTQWAPLYRNLEGYFNKGSKLESVEVLALALSDLAKISLHVMESGTLTSEESTYYDRLKLNAQREIDGVYLGPAKHMIKLIDSYRSQL